MLLCRWLRNPTPKPRILLSGERGRGERGGWWWWWLLAALSLLGFISTDKKAREDAIRKESVKKKFSFCARFVNTHCWIGYYYIKKKEGDIMRLTRIVSVIESQKSLYLIKIYRTNFWWCMKIEVKYYFKKAHDFVN